MTDATVPILFKRTDEPGPVYGGIPDRDLTQADWDRLDPGQRREVKHSALFAVAELTPAQKGALTRRENEQREAAELEAEAAARAAQDAGETGEQDGE